MIRRAFFKALACGAGASPLLLALPKVVAPVAPLPVAPPPRTPVEEIVSHIAEEAHAMLRQHLGWRNLSERAYSDTFTTEARALSSHLFDKHVAVDLKLPNIWDALAQPELLTSLLRPLRPRMSDLAAFIELDILEEIATSGSRIDPCLLTCKLPMPVPGTGAYGVMARSKDLGLRLIMSFCPKTLGQRFSVDILYGVRGLGNHPMHHLRKLSDPYEPPLTWLS